MIFRFNQAVTVVNNKIMRRVDLRLVESKVVDDIGVDSNIKLGKRSQWLELLFSENEGGAAIYC